MPGNTRYILVPFNAGNGFKGFHVYLRIDHAQWDHMDLARRIRVCLEDENVVCAAKTTIVDYVKNRAVGVETHPLHVTYVQSISFFVLLL